MNDAGPKRPQGILGWHYGGHGPIRKGVVHPARIFPVQHPMDASTALRDGLQQPFHDGIVNAGTKAPDAHVRAGRMDPVGQEHHADPPFEIQPEGGPGEPQMPHTVG